MCSACDSVRGCAIAGIDQGWSVSVFDRDDTKADVIRSTRRFIPHATCGATGPTIFDPRTTAPHAGVGPIAIRYTPGVMKIGIGSTGQSGVIPVTAPFPDVPVHIVNAPGIRRKTADTPRTSARGRMSIRALPGAIVVDLIDVKGIAE